ncbi:MAG: hypothetical protein IPM56_08285 [Ignavibacteriales bacterium]|nr:MAG: hypothetical protein IPM56_08285 [Ignavibacteriales bacterium]
MEKDLIQFKIEEFLDGELKREEEESLFAELALNSEARVYLRQLSLLKQNQFNQEEEFPQRLEEKILVSTIMKDSVLTRNQRASTIGRYMTVGISTVLIILSIYLFNTMNLYKTELKTVVNSSREQQEIIKALYNALPSAEVRATYSNEIIVKPNS